MATQSIPLCPDCGKPLHQEHYERPNGRSYDTYTCKTNGCLLNWVTLTLDKWQVSAALEPYRVMNRKAAQS
jgi:hypothetical protein